MKTKRGDEIAIHAISARQLEPTERYMNFPGPKNGEPLENLIDIEPVDDSVNRVLCGGSFLNFALFAKSANRDYNNQFESYYSNGFRLARTYP